MTENNRYITPKCRFWNDSVHNYCFAEAVLIVWGKLNGINDLGPRCIDHLPYYIRDMTEEGLGKYAVYDLRPANEAIRLKESMDYIMEMMPKIMGLTA